MHSSAPATTPPFLLDALPGHVRTDLMDFLPPDDVAALLEVSKDVQQATARALRSWEPDWWPGEAAATRFLRRVPNLQRFSFTMRCGDWYDDEEVAAYDEAGQLAAAIGTGSVGGQLRSLRVPGNEDLPVVCALLGHLQAGRLPFLVDLELDFYRCLPSDAEEKGTALAEALEARSRLGLAPVTRIAGIAHFPSNVLRRLWSCCPAPLITHLEASYGPQIAALGAYLLTHSKFAALRYLSIDGMAHGPQADLTDVWQALGQGTHRRSRRSSSGIVMEAFWARSPPWAR